jgi:hypothetical protein
MVDIWIIKSLSEKDVNNSGTSGNGEDVRKVWVGSRVALVVIGIFWEIL